eukprot:2680348-Heterocapsa_arctica.AAC.1
MTHFPYNPMCLDCAAKLKAQPARRTRRADPVQETVPTFFGDLVAMDYLILRGPDAGLQGGKAGLLIADIGTESLSFVPMQRKTHQLCTQALRDFQGHDSYKLISSDNAPELVRATTELGVPHHTGTPYRSTSNGRIENLLG